MKILCICQKGNSRSVGFAWLLKMKYRVDALACGFKTQSDLTKNMLYEWADYIILMAPQYRDLIPMQYSEKLLVLNVGHDTYFKGIDESLVEQCEKFLSLHGELTHG